MKLSIDILGCARLVTWMAACGTPEENARMEADEDREFTAGNEAAELGDKPSDMDFKDPAGYPEAEMEAEP